MRLDHLTIMVHDAARSRAWYTAKPSCALGLRVHDVDVKQSGPSARTPDGDLVYVWDERTMRQKGGG